MAAAAAAAAADPSSPSLSPRASLAARHPWPLVNGAEPEGPAADVLPSPSSPSPAVAIADLEISDRSPQEVHAEEWFTDAAQGTKQAWKRPDNVSAKAGGAVMGGAASWPALSETAKPSPKSSSSDTLKSLAEAPLSAPAGTTISTSSPKPNSNPYLSRNHTTPARQKTMKRGGGSNISSSFASGDGGMTLPSPSPTLSPMANSEKHAPSEIPFSPRDQITRKNTNWDRGNTLGRSVLHANDGSDLKSYGGYRRWNNGGGAGSHNNYNNHRDVERGVYDGYRRNAGGTDARMQPRNARLLRPPTSPVAPPFLGPPPQVGPFGNQIVFPDVPSPVFYIATQPPPGGVPFVPHPAVLPQMFIPTIDPQRSNLLKQIDYYFSAENLCRDVYLRQNMDEQGWVPVSLIAGFNRVKQLTNSIEFILETLQLSAVLEVQGDKIRKHHDWMNWVLPPTDKQSANVSSQLSTSPNFNNLAACHGIGYTYQNSMRLPNPSELLLSRSASGNLSNQIEVPVNHNWDANGQVMIADSDKIKPGRSLLRSDTF
ncbi:la-related protein 1B-like [Zingiber officinale]|uniref:la-related protein 1B-like n=1 Tax=Zingiber officinale TaxID=94328 RepID=UPI001C4CDDEE|nr:la-related protein 1B-like [Zingiber officinale]